MATVSSADPRFRAALDACVGALKKVAEYELETPIEQRMRELGERKEWLGPEEHAELMALVEFARKRTHDALEARLALQRLREFDPDAVAAP